MDINAISEPGKSTYELCIEATRLLKNHGFDIRGLPNTKDSYPKARFEESMFLGAYSVRNSRRKR